jgi:serine/threonine protein kinase
MLVRYDQYFTGIEDITDNGRMSKNAKDLLKRMLDVNPTTRCSAQEMLDHTFFKTKGRLTLATRNFLNGVRSTPSLNDDQTLAMSYIDVRDCKRRRVDLDEEIRRAGEEREFDEEMTEMWKAEERRQEELQRALRK